ncbi:hypothetical protein BDK51DRAFT_46230, partial [Blyttiomyces helicus]
GYLTHRLAHHLPTTAIESSPTLVSGSQARASLLASPHHSVGAGQPHPINYLSVRVDEDGLVGVVEAVGGRCLVVGLHACGDLGGGVMVGAFGRTTLPPDSPSANTSAPASPPTPLLTKRSLSLACQTLSQASSPTVLYTGPFRARYHRALLELLLPPSPTPKSIGALPASSRDSFRAYVAAAAQKLQLPVVDDERVAAVEAEFGGGRGEWRMAFVALVRSLVGPVVESLVVADRGAAVAEWGGGGGVAVVEALFDVGVSPRNMVVVGVKGEDTYV